MILSRLVAGLAAIVIACGTASADTRYTGRQVMAAGGVKVMQFTGIRYAQPPTGKFRWRAPRPVAAAARVDATHWPPACMQDDGNVKWYRRVAAGFGKSPGDTPTLPQVSEDCLFLNVWTPHRRGHLPVMVWIHGGGNVNGWSFEPDYRGRNLAAKGVVVVSIQYRLGVFGFLALPTLTAESPNHTSGNYGIQDQLQALRWVQHNIHQFGGDPNNVTVFGESSGAGDIGYLLLSPLSRGLFRRAITESGGWPAIQKVTLADAEAGGERFLRETGASSLKQLREMPASELLAMAAAYINRSYYDPPVDGWLLPQAPAKLLRSGKFEPRPVIFGTNADEWLMYIKDASEANWKRVLAEADPSGRVTPRIETLLHGLPLRRRIAALTTAQEMYCPTLTMAKAFASSGAPTYVYHFTRVREGSRLGAYHGAEIPYVFDTHARWLPTDNIDRALTSTIMNYWTDFARNGDPNHTGAPHWPQWDTAAKAMILGDSPAARPLDQQLCRLLEQR